MHHWLITTSHLVTMQSARHIIARLAGGSLLTLLLAGALGACSRDDGKAPALDASAAAPAAAAASASASTPPASVATAPPVPVAHDGERAAAWMRAIFRDAYDPVRKQALVTLPIFDYPKPYLMSLTSAAALADGRFALIVVGTPGPDDLVPDAHDEHEVARAYSADRLNVYIVRPQADGWTVEGRHESLATMAKEPERRAVRWTSLGAGKPGFTITTDFVGAPLSGKVLEIFELANGARKLAELSQSSDNDNDCSIETEACWNIAGTPQFAGTASPDGYADLLIDFQGKRYRYSEDDDGMTIVVPVATVAQSARYRFDGKAYELVAGSNPVEDL